MNDKIFFWMWWITSWWWSNKIKYNEEIKKLVKLAYDNWINKFDSALVYGWWLWESIFHNLDFLDKLIISTKIPAINKPELSKVYTLEEIKTFYNYEYIEKSILCSIKKIWVESIDILYLHNWNKSWEKHFDYFSDIFKRLKEDWYVKNIWISLPDDYDWNFWWVKGLFVIDYIQLPHNLLNESILENTYSTFQRNWIKIVVRSIFLQWIILDPLKIHNLNNLDLRYKKYINNIDSINYTIKSFIKNNNIEKKDLYKKIINRYIQDKRIDYIILWLSNEEVFFNNLNIINKIWKN